MWKKKDFSKKKKNCEVTKVKLHENREYKNFKEVCETENGQIKKNKK